MAMPALVHWTPDDDAIEHEESERCVCGPHREPVGYRQVASTYQRVFAVIHARLDGQDRMAWEA